MPPPEPVSSMNGAAIRDTYPARPTPPLGNRRNDGRPFQSPRYMPPGLYQIPAATESNSPPSNTEQAYRSRHTRSHFNPSYVNDFLSEIGERLKTAARRKFPNRPSDQDEWFNTKFEQIRDNYTPRQGTRPRSPNHLPKVEGWIMYLGKAAENVPDADRVRCQVTKFDLADPSTVEQSLQQAQNEWDSTYGSDSLDPIVWVHIPANNVGLVRSVVPGVMAARCDNSFPQDTDWNKTAEQFFDEEFWDHQCRSHKRNPVFSRTMEPFATCFDVNLEVQSTSPSKHSVNILAAFMPYLHWESSVAATYMRHVVQDVERQHLLKTNDNSPLDRYVCQDEALLREHLFSEFPMHPRRTLDQFSYPLMVDTSERDADQVIERYALEGHFDEEAHFDSEPPILMVDQCWVWAIGTNTVVTAFPKTWDGHNQSWDPLDLRTTIESNIQKSRHKHFLRCATEFARFVLRISAINILLPSKQIREPQKFLQYFDYAIAELCQRKINTFKDSKLWWDHCSTLETKLSTLDAIFHVQEEYKMLEETRDIIEELRMMCKILDDQDGVMRQFEQGQKKSYARAGISQYISATRKKSEIGSFTTERPAMKMRRANIHRLIQKAEEVAADIQNQLGVKHQQAGMIEAQFARRSNEQAHKQGAILMVFTAVTIIFLPLSTMASIFGINTVNLGSGSMHIGFILAIIFSIICVGACFMITMNRRLREWLFGKSETLYAKVFPSDKHENGRLGNSKGSAHQIPADRFQGRFETNSRNGSMLPHLGSQRPPTSNSRNTIQSSVSMDALALLDSSSQPRMSILRRDYQPGANHRQRPSGRRNSRFMQTSSEAWRAQDTAEFSLSEGEESDPAVTSHEDKV